MSDLQLLGGGFAGPSWDLWKTVMRAAWAEPLSKKEVVRFKSVAGDREPPERPVSQIVLIVGRRGGKDSVSGAVATALAINGERYKVYTRPGERPCVLVIAVDRTQARGLHRYIAANFRENPMLRNLVLRETSDTLELSNGVEIIVATNSFRAIRGRTIVAAILNECAFYRGDDAASSDEELFRAIGPGTATIPGSVVMLISSPYRKAGLLFRKWRESFGKDDPNTLVIQGATKVFNETAPQDIIDRDVAEDPASARAEWFAEWRDDLESFVAREVVEGAVLQGVREIPPSIGPFFFGFIDPAGGSGQDSYAVAVARTAADGRAELCLVKEWKPRFLPLEVSEEAAAIFKSYGITEVRGDAFGGDFARAPLERAGISYFVSATSKSDLYKKFLPRLNSGQVSLVDNPTLINQLCSLERKTAWGGKDSIDHPARVHDDVCNAAVGALLQVFDQPAQAMGFPDFAGVADMTIHHDPHTSSGSRTASDLPTFNPLLNSRWEPVRGDW